jgi:hypothetical protein
VELLAMAGVNSNIDWHPAALALYRNVRRYMQAILVDIPTDTTIEQLRAAVMSKSRRFFFFGRKFKVLDYGILDIYGRKNRLIESHGIVTFDAKVGLDDAIKKLSGIRVNNRFVQVRRYFPRSPTDHRVLGKYEIPTFWRRTNTIEVLRLTGNPI